MRFKIVEHRRRFLRVTTKNVYESDHVADTCVRWLKACMDISGDISRGYRSVVLTDNGDPVATHGRSGWRTFSTGWVARR